jgi:hypothetical protein
LTLSGTFVGSGPFSTFFGSCAARFLLGGGGGSGSKTETVLTDTGGNLGIFTGTHRSCTTVNRRTISP